MTFDKAETLAVLNRLDKRRRTAFASLTAARLLPNYDPFERETGWGDSAALRAALELAWRSARGEAVDAVRLEKARAKAEALAPDTNRFTSDHTSAALDAASAVAYALDSITDESDVSAWYAANAARNSVESFAEVSQGEDPAESPLVTQEIRRQRQSLADLEALSELSREDIERLRLKYGGASFRLSGS